MGRSIDILILTAGFGTGHLSAALGIKEHIQKEKPTINVEIIDAFQIIIPKLSTIMYKGYDVLVRKSPRLYNHFYYKDNQRPKPNNKRYSNKYILNRLKSYIIDINPQLIISTFPVISQYLSILRDTFEISISLITCITDVVHGWEWLTPNCDIYFVATKAMKNGMLDMGIENEKIVVTGIPLRKEFLELPKPLIDISLAPGHKVLMIMGGGTGLISTDKEFYLWLNTLKKITTMVLTGNNENLYKSISKLELENVIPLKYTDEVSSLMERSDLLISKAGGITLFEAIASNLPFIAYKPELGQEIENSKFISQESIGDIALNMEELKCIITDLINNKKKIDNYRKNIINLKKDIDMRTLAEESIKYMKKTC